ncbi:MAG TPA: ankyrin repeat domain-containing protein [Paraburkholderia sp.]|jgi:ankyrin repeat protein|nr:ankyrin repeat domain-containing protein [Paraburkholderia sp.]
MNTLTLPLIRRPGRAASRLRTASGLRRALAACAAALVAAAAVAPAYGADTDSIVKAVKFDDDKRIAKLLVQGVDPNMTTPDKLHMPLIVLAAREKSDKVAKVLALNPKTDLDKVDSADENAMMLAALNGDLDLVKLLIDKDAEVNKKGWAPLHYAAANGHDDIVQLLIDHSAYLDTPSPNGTTPLMMAARGNHITTMKVLLDAGADPRVKNQIGMTALDFAKQYHAKDATEGLEAMFARDAASASAVAPASGQNGAK